MGGAVLTPRSSSSVSSSAWAAWASSSGHNHHAPQLQFEVLVIVGGVGGTQRRQLRHALRLKFEVLDDVGGAVLQRS